MLRALLLTALAAQCAALKAGKAPPKPAVDVRMQFGRRAAAVVEIPAEPEVPEFITVAADLVRLAGFEPELQTSHGLEPLIFVSLMCLGPTRDRASRPCVSAPVLS